MNKTPLNSQKEKHSTLSLRRATPEASSASPRGSISIHALLAESDTTLSHNYNTTIISIHALLAESDRVGECFVIAAGVFLSTLSLRRATNTGQPVRGLPSYFYPRSPCGERRGCRPHAAGTIAFLSTLSLRRATKRQPISKTKILFLSTLSLRRGTPVGKKTGDQQTFLSTLSLRRATASFFNGRSCFSDFYPRSPCGERLICNVPQQPCVVISIHALLAESDGQPGRSGQVCNHFYPRSPCGERRR